MDIKDDAFIIPEYIWENKKYNLEQKIVCAFIHTHCNGVFTLRELENATHLTRGKLIRALTYLINQDVVHRKKIITEKDTIGTIYMFYTGNEEFLQNIDWSKTKRIPL